MLRLRVQTQRGVFILHLQDAEVDLPLVHDIPEKRVAVLIREIEAVAELRRADRSQRSGVVELEAMKAPLVDLPAQGRLPAIERHARLAHDCARDAGIATVEHADRPAHDRDGIDRRGIGRHRGRAVAGAAGVDVGVVAAHVGGVALLKIADADVVQHIREIDARDVINHVAREHGDRLRHFHDLLVRAERVARVRTVIAFVLGHDDLERLELDRLFVFRGAGRRGRRRRSLRRHLRDTDCQCQQRGLETARQDKFTGRPRRRCDRR